jgi:hypothetical protein
MSGDTDEIRKKKAMILANALAEAERQEAEQQQTAPAPSGPPQVPEGFFMNPVTGQMTSRALLKNNIEPSQSRAVLGGAMQGVGFNFGDELIGAAGYLQGGPEMARYRMEQARATLEADREAYPKTSIGGEIGGALVPAAVSAPYALGRTLWGTVARGIGIRATEGTLFGSGRGEGMKDRAVKAGQDAVVGAAVGGIAPAAFRAAKAGFNAAKDPASGIVDALLDRPSQGRANRAISSSLQRSGQTAEEVTQAVQGASREGQPDFRLMDALGMPGQRRASGVARAGGEGAADLARFLNQRQLDQGDRISGFVEDAFGFKANTPTTPGTELVPGGQDIPKTLGGVLSGRQTTAQRTIEALQAARKSAGDINYDAARANAGPVDVRGALSVIDERLAPMRGSGVKGDRIDALYARFEAKLAAPAKALNPGETARELSDFDRVLGVRREVQDAVSKARVKGAKFEASQLSKLDRALDTALEDASALYRRANDEFRTASRVIDAVGQGADMTRRGSRSADNVEEFARMTADQQSAARVGYSDRLLANLEANPGPTANLARPFGSTKVTAETGAMATNPEVFQNRITREGQMFETQQRALRGALTADNLEDVNDTTGQIANIVRSLRSAGAGGAAGAAVQAVAPYAKGQNAATRNLIAEILMSADPATALAPAILQATRSNQSQIAASAMARAIAQRR